MAHDAYSYGERATWTRDYDADDLRSELRAECARPPVCTCENPECWRPHYDDLEDEPDPTPDEEEDA